MKGLKFHTSHSALHYLVNILLTFIGCVSLDCFKDFVEFLMLYVTTSVPGVARSKA
jgi:hypothetical protein